MSFSESLKGGGKVSEMRRGGGGAGGVLLSN